MQTESLEVTEDEDYESILAPPERIILNDLARGKQCVSDPFPSVGDVTFDVSVMFSRIIFEPYFICMLKDCYTIS